MMHAWQFLRVYCTKSTIYILYSNSIQKKHCSYIRFSCCKGGMFMSCIKLGNTALGSIWLYQAVRVQLTVLYIGCRPDPYST